MALQESLSQCAVKIIWEPIPQNTTSSMPLAVSWGAMVKLVKAASSHICCRCAVVDTLAHRRDGLQSTQNKLHVDLKVKS